MGDPVERRKNEKRLITHVVEIFNGKQGRKVAFGIWGFWVSTSLRLADKITADHWWYCFLTCALLIGFGTTLDTVITKLGDAVVVIFADRAAKLNNVTKVTTETTVETPAAPPVQS